MYFFNALWQAKLGPMRNYTERLAVSQSRIVTVTRGIFYSRLDLSLVYMQPGN
jgi:hypothetical protein